MYHGGWLDLKTCATLAESRQCVANWVDDRRTNVWLSQNHHTHTPHFKVQCYGYSNSFSFALFFFFWWIALSAVILHVFCRFCCKENVLILFWLIFCCCYCCCGTPFWSFRSIFDFEFAIRRHAMSLPMSANMANSIANSTTNVHTHAYVRTQRTKMYEFGSISTQNYKWQRVWSDSWPKIIRSVWCVI